MGLVQAGPQQIVHRRVHDGERFRAGLLDVEDARQQHAGVPRDHAAGFHDDLALRRLQERRHGIGVFPGMRRRFVRIGNAESSADVQIPDRNAPAFQRLDQLHDLFQGLHKGTDLRQLRADVRVHPDDFDVGKRRRL